MIYVGIDDTDTLDHPGTNQLARHLVGQCADLVRVRWITRHQLLQDPRVPCTSRNGCAALACEPLGEPEWVMMELIDRVPRIMLGWCPAGSDPGLCVAADPLSPEIVSYALGCQQKFVEQFEARDLAEAHGIYLEGLGGTQDGVIGALAAVGLASTGDDGRVIYSGEAPQDFFEMRGVWEVAELLRSGVHEIRQLTGGQRVLTGTVDVGKRLRPNMREAKVVLFVEPLDREANVWCAQRVL